MAVHAKNLSLLLLVVFFTTSLQTEARESKFFTKAIHYHINKSNVPQLEIAPSPASSQSLAPTPTPTPTPELAPAPIEAEYGYGLYGQGSYNQNSLPENQNGAEENVNSISGEYVTPDQSYMKADENAMLTGELTTDQSYMKANENAKFPSGDDQFTTDHQSYMNSGDKNGYSDNYNNEKNGYGDSKNYGLSDTRFLENGKYYYDVKNENNYFQTGNAPVMGNGIINSNDEGYYGNYNEGSKYEFDTMEEYERQEGYPEIQREEYNP